MAGAVTASPNPAKGYQTVTLTLSGFAATTAHTVTLATPSGHNQTVPVTTDGSGAATLRVVPSQGGTNTVTVYVTAPVVAASTTFQCSGSSA